MTTTTSRPVCPKCGTIKKSAKTSCCGRGGSWFRNCGSAGNRNFPHTWSEGILVCKKQAQLNTITNTTMITHTDKAATISSNWVSQGKVHACDTYMHTSVMLQCCANRQSRNISISSSTHTACPHADLLAAVVVIVCTLLVFLVVITSISTGYHLIRKNVTIKKGLPVTVP